MGSRAHTAHARRRRWHGGRCLESTGPEVGQRQLEEMQVSANPTTVPQTAPRQHGGISEVALLAYPAVLHTLSDTLMHTVDSMIVGRLGTAELGGVGLGGIWLWTLVVTFVGVANGLQTFVAQSYGAGRWRACGPWLWQALWVLGPATVFWVVIIALAFPWMVRHSGASPELGTVATQYLLARLPGIPFMICGVVLTAFLRGLGDTRTPLWASVGANLLNAVLAFSLVFGLAGFPKLGVTGAGLATSCANVVYASVLFALVLRPRRRSTFATRPVRPSGSAIRRYLRTSLPLGGQWFLDMLSFAVFSTILAQMGSVAMAASQAMIQLLSLSFMQAYGISAAAAALVGRYVGAADFASAERSHWSALKLGLLLALAVAALFLLLPEPLLMLFTRDPQVLEVGRKLLALGALFQFLDAVGIVTSGSLRGAGDTRFPFLLQALFAWILRLPLVYWVAIHWQGGVLGAWVAELIYVTVLGSAWLWRFHRGTWQKQRI